MPRIQVRDFPIIKDSSPETLNRVVVQLYDILRVMATQINNISEGKIAGHYAARESTPTSGSATKGDFLLNPNPVELGTNGSKYMIIGRECTASGSPGTWKEMRVLTGA